MVRERRPEGHDQVALVHEPAGDGCAAAPQHATAQRVAVGDLPLGFERGGHGRGDPLGEGDHGVHVEAGAGADDDQRSPRGGDALDRCGQDVGGGSHLPLRHPTGRPTRGRALGCGKYLHLVGQHQVAHGPLHDGVLAGQGHEFGVVAAGVHRLAVRRHVGERRLEVEILERAPSRHRRRHLPGHGQHRGTVHLGVVQARSAGWSSPARRWRNRPPGARSACRRRRPRTTPPPRGGCRRSAGRRAARPGAWPRRSPGWSGRPCRRRHPRPSCTWSPPARR